MVLSNTEVLLERGEMNWVWWLTTIIIPFTKAKKRGLWSR
jgi:hypothetical protein